MRRSWKALTFSSVSTAANEVRGEKRRGGPWGTGRTKLGSVLQGSGLNTGLVHTRQTLSHLDICGGPGSGHLPLLVLKSTDAKLLLSTSTAFASAQARCLSCILQITQNHHSQLSVSGQCSPWFFFSNISNLQLAESEATEPKGYEG